MVKRTIPASDEAWDDRTLGADKEFVEVVDQASEESIDEAVGMQMISIRLQKSMIEDFKLIASLSGGLGYQTLMRQVLRRFVECEKKRLFRELVSEKLQEEQKQQQKQPPAQEQPKVKPRQRKAA